MTTHTLRRGTLDNTGLINTPTMTTKKEEIINKTFPHTAMCVEKMIELGEKFNLTADCLCEPEIRNSRKELSKSLDSYLAYGIEECMPEEVIQPEDGLDRMDYYDDVETCNFDKGFNNCRSQFKSNAKSKFNIEVK